MIVAPPCRGCPGFAELQRRNAELELELSEWRAQDRGHREALETIERCVRIKDLLGLSPARARVLIALIDHAGNVQTKDRLLHVCADDEDALPKMVDVHVCAIRAALTRAGFDGAIETVWGYGHRMSMAMASRLKSWLEDPLGDADHDTPSAYELSVLGSAMSVGSAAMVLGRAPEWIDAQRNIRGLRRSA